MKNTFEKYVLYITAGMLFFVITLDIYLTAKFPYSAQLNYFFYINLFAIGLSATYFFFLSAIFIKNYLITQSKNKVLKYNPAGENFPENANIISYKIDISKNKYPLLHLNNKAEIILGFTEKSIRKKSKNWLSFIAKEDKNYITSILKNINTLHSPYSMEYRLLNNHGQSIWFKDEGEIIRDKNGKNIYLKGILINIDEIKREKNKLVLSQKELEERIFERTTDLILTNNALLKQNRFINSIIESLSYPFFVINPDTYEIVMANSAAHHNNIKYGDKCYKSLHSLNKPCVEKKIFCPLKSVIKNKKSVKVEKKINNNISEIHAYPVFNSEHKIINVIIYCIDVTTRKISEEKTRESEEKFRTIFEESFIGLLVFNSKGELIQQNKAATNYLEINNEEKFKPINLFNTDIIPEDSKEELLQGNTIKYENEFDIYKVDAKQKKFTKNTFRQFDVIITPVIIRKEQGIKFFILHLRDITNKNNIEKKLRISRYEAEEANRLKSEFLANISHDLRTPLNAIINFSRALNKGIIGQLTHEQKDIAERIFNSGKRLIQLINDLLDISKIESGNMDILITKIFLPDLKKIIKEAAVPYQKNEVKLNIEIESNFFFTDKMKVEQIIYNLVSNAFKFTDQGSVSVIIKTIEEILFIYVSDTGVGINEKDINIIFDKYIQSSKIAKVKSTGLGLAIVKELAKLLGGYVEVKSKTKSGSEFTVQISDMRENMHKNGEKTLTG